MAKFESKTNTMSQKLIGCRVEVLKEIGVQLEVGSRVSAQWQSGDQQPTYTGEIIKINDDNSYKVQFKDGDTRLFCPKEDLFARPIGTIETIERTGYYVKLNHEETSRFIEFEYVNSLSCPQEELNKKKKQLQKESMKYVEEGEIYSFDAAMVLQIGNNEEVSYNILSTYYRPYGICCIVNIGETDLSGNILKEAMEKVLQRDELKSSTLSIKAFDITSCVQIKFNGDYDQLKFEMSSTVSDKWKNNIKSNQELVKRGDILVKIIISHLNKSDQENARDALTSKNFRLALDTILDQASRPDNPAFDPTIIFNENRTITYKELYTERSAALIRAITKAGIKTHLFKDPYHDQTYCMLGVTENRLKQEACQNRYFVRLNKAKAFAEASSQNRCAGMELTHVTANNSIPGKALKMPFKKVEPVNGEYNFPSGFQKGDTILITLLKYQGNFQSIKFFNSTNDIIFSFTPILKEKIVERNAIFNGNPGRVEKKGGWLDAFNNDKIQFSVARRENKFEVRINDKHIKEYDFKFRHRKLGLSERSGTVKKIIVPHWKQSVKLLKILRKGEISLKDWEVYVSYIPKPQDFDLLYKKYDRPYCKNPKSKTIFEHTDRTKLLISILEEKNVTKFHGARLNIEKLICDDDSPLSHFYPLHNEEKLKKVEKIMSSTSWSTGFMDSKVDHSSGDSKIDFCRSYFGEQIAFYFSFMSFYTFALIPMAIFGLAVAIWQHLEGTNNIVILPFFALANSIWASVFMDLWKRKESILRFRWGMINFEDQEKVRPSFHGECRRSPIDGAEEEFFHPIKRGKLIIFSVSVFFAFVFLVIVTISGLFLFRSYLMHTSMDDNFAIYLCSVLAAIQIKVLNVFYGHIAIWLTGLENHETDTQYYNSLMVKNFVFKFINAYKTIFYTAFYQEYDIGCGNQDCMHILQKHILGLFLSSIIGSLFLGTIKPMLTRCQRIKKLKKAAKNFLRPEIHETKPLLQDDDSTNYQEQGSQDQALTEEKPPTREEGAIEQWLKSEYKSTFDDFDQIVIRYGYLSLFVVVVPVMPFLALLSQFWETHMDSRSLCTNYRRPEPRSAKGIGGWGTLLSLLRYVAVFTNVAILYDTWEIHGWGSEHIVRKILLFFMVEHVLLFFTASIPWLIPDEPYKVQVRKKRRKYLEKILVQDSLYVEKGKHGQLEEKDDNNLTDTSCSSYTIPLSIRGSEPVTFNTVYEQTKKMISCYYNFKSFKEANKLNLEDDKFKYW